MYPQIIHINYHQGRGQMTLVLDEFFPTTLARVRRLKSLINEDYKHQDELRAAIVRHCEQRAGDLLDGRRELANQAVNYHTEATEMQPEIDKLVQQVSTLQQYIKARGRRRYVQDCRRQLKALKAQLKGLKEEQQRAFSRFRDCRKRFESAEGDAEKLKKNAEVMAYGS